MLGGLGVQDRALSLLWLRSLFWLEFHPTQAWDLLYALGAAKKKKRCFIEFHGGMEKYILKTCSIYREDVNKNDVFSP